MFCMKSGGNTVNLSSLCCFSVWGDFLLKYKRSDFVSNIKYNEEQEAFELPYKLWDNMITVRFYTESESDIIENLSDIAFQLETVNGGKSAVAELISDERLYNGDDDALKDLLCLESVYVDIDEDEIVVCFTVSTTDGYMCSVDMELYDGEFEITGRN